jgi:hypothetical protein
VIKTAIVGSSSSAVPCANGRRIDKRSSLYVSGIPRKRYRAIACNNFAHPTTPNKAEKNEELNAPSKIKYGDKLI